MFRHCKTNEFNLEGTHLKDLKRIEALFAAVVSALTLVFLVGLKEETSSPTPYKKSIKYHAFSTFRRGFDFLRKLLIQSKTQAIECIVALLLLIDTLMSQFKKMVGNVIFPLAFQCIIKKQIEI